MNRHDEIKKLLSASRNLLNRESVNESTEILNKYYGLLNESDDEYETAEIESDEEENNEETPSDRKFEKKKTYRISGGLMSINDFNTLNLYPNNVEWSGKIQDLDIEFFFSIGETNGVYINGDMININDEFVEFITKLRTYYEKFKTKWSKVIANRKKTPKNK